MSLTLSRAVAVAATASLTAAVFVAISDEASAVRPCHIRTSAHLDSRAQFAGGGVLRRYTAKAHGSAKGGYDQTGKVVVTAYPQRSFPALINAKVGQRETIGDMVREQRRHAVGAINGDFFVFPDIRGVNSIEMSRGPMVRDGRIIRATYQRKRVVGLTRGREPFGGVLAIRGSIDTKALARPVPIRSINWQGVKPGGVNLYTSSWSDGVPRPRGHIEWVLNRHHKIREIRSPARNRNERGNPVRDGTMVLAFPRDKAKAVRGATVGTPVNVTRKQSTGRHVSLYTAIGRGLPMVLGGTAAPLGCNAYDHSKAARPRTFVGWNAKGRWMSLTVPGKTFDGIGLRTGGFGLANAANIAKSLGFQRAYELDGGGSTTLWTRSKTGSWSRRDLYRVNTDVCSCERPMTNGLAFIKR
jgi:hypothetical protein